MAKMKGSLRAAGLLAVAGAMAGMQGCTPTQALFGATLLDAQMEYEGRRDAARIEAQSRVDAAMISSGSGQSQTQYVTSFNTPRRLVDSFDAQWITDKGRIYGTLSIFENYLEFSQHDNGKGFFFVRDELILGVRGENSNFSGSGGRVRLEMSEGKHYVLEFSDGQLPEIVRTLNGYINN